MWEWGGETGYIHDEVATDKRDPRVNAGGPIYGVEFANDKLVWVDPVTNAAHEVSIPVRDQTGAGDRTNPLGVGEVKSGIRVAVG